MNEFDIGGTEQYLGNPPINGRFMVKDELINDYKCYEQGDNLIAWENDMFTNPGWVIHDKGNCWNGLQMFFRLILDGNPKFFSDTETNCPRDAQWRHLERPDMPEEDAPLVPGITVDGLTFPEITAARHESDPQEWSKFFISKN